MTSKVPSVPRALNILLSNNSNPPSYPPKSLSRFPAATFRASGRTYIQGSHMTVSAHERQADGNAPGTGAHVQYAFFPLSFCSSRTSSTSVSVSCLGISTCSFTRNSNPMNSWVPVRCWRGVRPALGSMSPHKFPGHFPLSPPSSPSSLAFRGQKRGQDSDEIPPEADTWHPAADPAPALFSS